MVDMWPEHVETMQRDGLRASGSQGDFTVPIKALHLTEAQNIVDQFDYAFISLKSYDTEWATHFIKRYVKPEGCFISLQNCWNDPVVGEIVGPERAMGCVASHIEVALWEPGHVQRGGAVGRDSGHVVFRVGEQTLQVTDRSQYVAGLLDNIDAAYATDNLWGERWAKLCQNSMGNAISAMTGMGTNELAVDQRCRTISINLAREAAQIGLALGYDVVAINDKPAQLWADAERGDAYEELDNYFANRRTRVNWLASMAPGRPQGPPLRGRLHERPSLRQGPRGRHPNALQRRNNLRHAANRRPRHARRPGAHRHRPAGGRRRVKAHVRPEPVEGPPYTPATPTATPAAPARRRATPGRAPPR